MPIRSLSLVEHKFGFYMKWVLVKICNSRPESNKSGPEPCIRGSGQFYNVYLCPLAILLKTHIVLLKLICLAVSSLHYAFVTIVYSFGLFIIMCLILANIIYKQVGCKRLKPFPNLLYITYCSTSMVRN